MSVRNLFPRQASLHWIELVILILLFLGILVLLNYIAYRHDRRFDMTPAKMYTLAPQTQRVLDSLTDDVHATIFYKPRERKEFQDLVELFSKASQRFHYRFIDLEKNPAKAEMLNIKAYGAGIVEYKGKKEKVQYFTEENIIRAIIRLSEKGEKIVRFVKGHGEKDIESFDEKQGYNLVRQALETENYKVESILLMQAGTIPDDTLLLVVSGPQKDLFQEELDMIEAYLNRGGRVLVLCDPYPLPRLESFLERYKIKLAHDFVLDTKSKLVALDYLTPIVIPDKQHPIARYMNDVVVFPVSRSVVAEDPASVAVFAQTGPDSWAERNTQSVYDNEARFDGDTDLPGPVPIAAVTQVVSPQQTSNRMDTGRLVVMGDSDFASNHYITILANKDFFLNTVNWLAEKSELLSTRAKADQTPVSILFLTENEARLVLWSAVIIEPGIILLIGALVVLWRRLKR